MNERTWKLSEDQTVQSALEREYKLKILLVSRKEDPKSKYSRVFTILQGTNEEISFAADSFNSFNDSQRSHVDACALLRRESNCVRNSDTARWRFKAPGIREDYREALQRLGECSRYRVRGTYERKRESV